jgi:hypothetical protein
MYKAFEDNESTPISKPKSLVCHPRSGREGPFFQNESSGGDARLVYQGTIYVANLVPSGQPSTKALGSLELVFSIDFLTRQLEAPVTALTASAGDTDAVNTNIANLSLNPAPQPVSNLIAATVGAAAATGGAVATAAGLAGASPAVQNSIVALGNAAAAIAPGIQTYLREGNYLVAASADVGIPALSNQPGLQIAGPQLNTVNGTTIMPPPDLAVDGNNDLINLNGGYVKNLIGTTGGGTGPEYANIYRTDLVMVPPGGAYLDGYTISADDPSGPFILSDVYDTNFTVTPIDYRIANMFIQAPAGPLSVLAFFQPPGNFPRKYKLTRPSIRRPRECVPRDDRPSSGKDLPENPPYTPGKGVNAEKLQAFVLAANMASIRLNTGAARTLLLTNPALAEAVIAREPKALEALLKLLQMTDAPKLREVGGTSMP